MPQVVRYQNLKQRLKDCLDKPVLLGSRWAIEIEGDAATTIVVLIMALLLPVENTCINCTTSLP
jgi:hypothetical protein